MEKKLKQNGTPKPQLHQEYDDLFHRVLTEKQREIAEKFDAIHSVQRAQQVGSLDRIVEPANLRQTVIEAIEAGLAREDELRKGTVAKERRAEA
jgi:uncharacterized pyridoxal phosphate-containing UPF0001 family protein